MAQTDPRIEYNGNGYYESVAYDTYSVYGSAVPKEAPETAAERDRKVRESAEERRREQERQEAVKRAKEAQSVSVFAVIGYIAVAAMMVFVLSGYIHLTEVSAEITSLKKEISLLETEQRRLSVEYETTFNTNRIAEYATGVLGMTKLSDQNTRIVRMEHDDRAEVLNADDSTGLGILRAVREAISKFSEYLR